MKLSRRRFLGWSVLGTSGLLAACQAGQPSEAPTGAAATGGPSPVAQPTLPPAPLAKPAASPPSVAAGPAPSPPVAVAASPSPARAAVAGKPMYQMDAQHTGRSPYAGPRRPSLLRSFDTGTPDLLPSDVPIRRPDFQSSSVIAPDGTIYIANFVGLLFALRDSPTASDRLEIVWRFRRAGYTSAHATPAIGSDGTVYLSFSGGAPASGSLHAFRAPTSGNEPQVVWQADLGPGRTSSSPAIGPDGTIYMVGGSGRLFAVASSGSIRWSAMAGPTLKGSPALAPDSRAVYVPSTDGKLYALAPPSGSGNEGSIRWTFEFGEHLGPTPPVAATPVPGAPGGGTGGSGIGSGATPSIGPDGTVYIGANNSNLYAIDPNGQQKWLFEAERELAGIWTAPALSQDNQTLYFGANKGGLYAVNARDGSKKWQFPVYGSIYASSALDSQGILYTGTTIEHVYAVDSATGQQVWDFDARDQVWTAPSIRPDGSLVMANRAGLIMVLGDAS
jgi:outer membrane protein assembly factor BamB